MGNRRWGLLALIVSVWTVVAIVAAGPDPDESTWLGTSNLDTIMLIVVLAGSALGALIIIWAKPVGPRDRKPVARRRRSGLAGLIAVTCLVLIWRPDLMQVFQDTTEEVDEAVSNVEAPAPDLQTDDQAEPVAELSDLIALAALAAALAGGIWLLRLTGPTSLEPLSEAEPWQPPVAASEDLGVVVDEARSRLETATDARSAVIATYASLERALAARGLPRRRSETAEEHLVRATSVLGADTRPFAEIGQLYAVARFSDQPISDDTRAAAVDALRRATDAVGAVT